MGWTYEICVWKKVIDDPLLEEWDYLQVWAGESFLAALWNLVKTKRRGFGCVKLVWR